MSQAVPFKDANQSVIVDSRPIYVSSNDPAEIVTNLTISNMTISGSFTGPSQDGVLCSNRR